MDNANTRDKICTNIYGCSEAARLREADTIPEFQDICSSCGSRTTYPAFMKLFFLCSCPLCSHLAFEKSTLPLSTEQILNMRRKLRERHCLLCGCEYRSLEERNGDWIIRASRVLKVFLGNPEITDLAEKLYRLCEEFGCSELNGLLLEMLNLMMEDKREMLESRVRRAETLLKIDLLDNLAAPSPDEP